MRVIEKISDLKAAVAAQKNAGKTVGLVPTMGFLHEGHVSLVEASRRENDITVLSIFVNPAQFGVNEDFDKYPKDIEGDFQKAEEAGTDIIFAPTAVEMYPQGYSTYVDIDGITDRMCGKSRPGHFKGVATVVTKLFNIVQPDKAYFGQKDAQQAAVIRKMVRELNINVDLAVCPIVREKDGLAMSSRNIYLNSEERKAALALSKSLFKAERLIKEGERDARKIRAFIEKEIGSESLADVDYVTVVDADTLDEIKLLKSSIVAAVAVRFGKTRLIDNIVVEVQ